MKLTVKPKVEKTAQHSMRIPVSLKEGLTILDKRADAHGVNLTGTIIAMLEQLQTELNEKFDAEDKAASTNADKLSARMLATSPHSNGADRDRA
jgi:hypothetical protein